MQHKFKALLRHSEQRLRIGQGRLSQQHQHLFREQDESHRLAKALALQKQLEQASDLVGAALDRRQLFDWLRKTAADQHRTQALRLELNRQEEIIKDCHRQVDAQRIQCRKLQGRRDRYVFLLKEEQSKHCLRQAAAEEYEIEERVSWTK